MIAPLLPKNSLSQTGFQLREDSVHYRGLDHPLSNVESIVSAELIHRIRYIGVGNSDDPQISFVLQMSGGEKVQVTEQTSWIKSSDPERVAQLRQMVLLIAEKTFKQRVRRYTDQVQRMGYFEYSGWRFFPGEGKVVDVGTGRAFLLANTDLLRHPWHLEVVPKGEGLGAKLLRRAKLETSGKIYGFGTISDTDVFFALLEHYFQLKW